jgi:hypothetical protein
MPEVSWLAAQLLASPRGLFYVSVVKVTTTVVLAVSVYSPVTWAECICEFCAMPISLAVKLTHDGLQVVALFSGSPSTIYDIVRASCQTTRCSSRHLLWHGTQKFATMFTHRIKFSNCSAWVAAAMLCLWWTFQSLASVASLDLIDYVVSHVISFISQLLFY